MKNIKFIKYVALIAVIAMTTFASSARADFVMNEPAPFVFQSGGTIPTGNAYSNSTSTAPTTPAPAPAPKPATTTPAPKPVVATASTPAKDSCESTSTAKEWGTENPALTASVGDATNNFLPNSFGEWLLIIVLVFTIVFLARYLYGDYQKKKEEEKLAVKTA